MEWLSQNWIWLALAGFMLVMMVRRGGAGGCCGSMHATPQRQPATDEGPLQKSAGDCCGGKGGHGGQHGAGEAAGCCGGREPGANKAPGDHACCGGAKAAAAQPAEPTSEARS